MGVADRTVLLPVEIFQEIFIMVAYFYDKGERSSVSQTLMNASQVCQRWRLMTLETGSAWGLSVDPHSVGEQWLEEILRRTNGTPLDVWTTIDDDRRDFSAPQWQRVFAEQPRIRIFRLWIDHAIPLGPLVSALNRPAPQLEDFSIYKNPKLFISEVIDGDIHHPSNRLFAGQAPALRVLGLGHWMVPLSIVNFSSVTDLQYHDHHGREISCSWIDVVKSMPNLFEFTLVGPPSRDDIWMTPPTNIAEPARLLKLSALSIVTHARVAQHITSLITSPPSCRTVLCVYLPPPVFHTEGAAMLEEAVSAPPFQAVEFKITNLTFIAKVVYGEVERETARSFVTDDIPRSVSVSALARLLTTLSREESPMATHLRNDLRRNLVLDFDINFTESGDAQDEEDMGHALAKFLSMFPRVEELTLSKNSIENTVLPSLQGYPPCMTAGDADIYTKSFPILLPSLARLKVFEDVMQNKRTEAIITEYAAWRRTMGRGDCTIETIQNLAR